MGVSEMGVSEMGFSRFRGCEYVVRDRVRSQTDSLHDFEYPLELDETISTLPGPLNLKFDKGDFDPTLNLTVPGAGRFANAEPCSRVAVRECVGLSL